MMAYSAFILAAGMGTRLRPYTDHKPKPMVPVHGRPVIDHTLDRLRGIGTKDITVNLHYMADILEAHLKEQPGLTLSFEEKLLDTGGGVKKALSTIKTDPFYVINGDAYWQNTNTEDALIQLSKAWDPKKMDILLLLQDTKSMILTKGVGDYIIDETGRAVRQKDRSGNYMFTGVRLCKSSIFNDTPDDAFSFMLMIDRAEKEGRLFGLPHKGDWHHISTPEELLNVERGAVT